jgi:hypothetical protein
MNELPDPPIEIGLTAAIVVVEDEEPAILIAGDGRIADTVARAGIVGGRRARYD